MAISKRRVIALGLKLGLGLLLFSGALLTWYLNSATFRESARARIVSAIEGRFPVRVELDSLRIRWWGIRLRLEGLRIFNGRFEEEAPAVEIDQVEVNLTVTSLWRPSAALDSVYLESPRIRIVKNPNGRFNLWNMFRNQNDLPPKLTAFIRLAIDELSIRDGLIAFLDQSFRLESSRGGMEIELEFAPGGGSYRGLLRLTDLDVDIGPLALRHLDSRMRLGLFENSIELDAIDLSSDQVSGTASGVIDDLGELVYRFRVDLQVSPASFERPDFGDFVGEGRVAVGGVFTGRKGEWGFGGRVATPKLIVKELLFEDVESELRANSESLAVDRAEARFEGGAVKAKGELSWGDTGQSVFDVEGEGLRVERLLAPLPLGPFRPRGNVSARGRVQWLGLDWDSLTGTGQANFGGQFRFVPTGASWNAAEPFPFSGRTDFSLDRSRATFSGARADLLSGALDSHGWVGFDGSYAVRLDFQAPAGGPAIHAATEAGVLAPEVLEAWRPEATGPVRMGADLEGSGRDFQLAGGASFSQVALNRFDLGTLTTTFALSPEGVRANPLLLEGPGGRWTGSLAYDFGGEGDGRWVGLKLEGGGEAERLARLAGLDQPLSGRISGRFELEEPAPGRLSGRGAFAWERPAWDLLRFDSVEGDWEWADRSVEVTRLKATLEEGTVEGRLGFNLDSRAVEGRLRGERIPLEPFRVLSEPLARTELDGLADFTIQVSGTVDRPAVEVEASSDSVRVAGLDLRRLRLSGSRDGTADDLARFQLAADVLGDRLSATGGVGLVSPYPLTVSLQLDRFPLGPGLKLLPFETDIELGGEATGSVEVSGPLADFEAVEAVAVLSRLRVTMADYLVENRSNVTAVYKAGALRLLPLTMVGPQTELNLSGTVGLRGDRVLDLKANGELNLLLFNTFVTGGSTFGQVRLETVLTGTLDQPRIVGQASLERGFLRHPAVPATFFDARGKFRFTADQIGIDEFSARTSYGTLNAEGGIFLDGLTPVRWLVNVFGSGLRLEYPENVLSTLDIDLDWINNEDSQLLSGVVYVRSAEYREQVTVPDLILRYGSGSDLLTAGPGDAPGDIVLDLEVEGYRTLEIDNNLAKVTASGDFRVRGTLQNPVILGSLTVDEGKLFLENNEYDVSRGSITFNDPRRTRPVFDFEAETDVRDFAVSVILRGPLDQLNVSFRSDPPLANSSIVSLLAVGQTEEEIFGVEGRGQDQVGSLAIYGAGALLSKSLGKKLEAQTSRLFGFDKLSIDPFLYGNERDPGARVTLGKRLSKDLSVTYSTDLGNEGQGQTVVVELKLTDWLTVVGTGEQTGAVAVDFKLRKRF